MPKFYYVTGFCKTTGYLSLIAVSYEYRDGGYHKCGMGCSLAKNNCPASCKVFDDAPETLSEDKWWELRDELIGAKSRY